MTKAGEVPSSLLTATRRGPGHGGRGSLAYAGTDGGRERLWRSAITCTSAANASGAHYVADVLDTTCPAERQCSLQAITYGGFTAHASIIDEIAFSRVIALSDRLVRLSYAGQADHGCVVTPQEDRARGLVQPHGSCADQSAVERGSRDEASDVQRTFFAERYFDFAQHDIRTAQHDEVGRLFVIPSAYRKHLSGERSLCRDVPPRDVSTSLNMTGASLNMTKAEGSQPRSLNDSDPATAWQRC